MVKFIILPLIFTFSGADKAKIDELTSDVLWMSTAVYFESRSGKQEGSSNHPRTESKVDVFLIQ